MNPFIIILLAFFLLGGGSIAMAIAILQAPEPGAASYCWWC